MMTSRRSHIKLHGIASIVQRDGKRGVADYLAIRPIVSWHWGIEGPPIFKNGKFTAPKTIWPPLEMP